MVTRDDARGLFVKLREGSEAMMRRSAKAPATTLVGSSWSGMARAVVDACSSGSAAPVAGASFDVLLSLVGVEDAQTKLLRSIENQIGILRESRFLTGRGLIEDAARSRDAVRTHELLSEAVREFRAAQHLAETASERGVVETHLGVVWLLLGDREESEHWFTTAHGTLAAEAARLAQTAGDVRILKSRTATGLSAYFVYPGVVVLTKKVVKVRRAETARLALLELQPLLTAVSQSVAALGGDRLPSYELTQGAGGWQMSPIVPALPLGRRPADSHIAAPQECGHGVARWNPPQIQSKL